MDKDGEPKAKRAKSARSASAASAPAGPAEVAKKPEKKEPSQAALRKVRLLTNRMERKRTEQARPKTSAIPRVMPHVQSQHPPQKRP